MTNSQNETVLHLDLPGIKKVRSGKVREVFDLGEMKRVSQWARGRGIGLPLDGARLYLAAAYSGVPVREYAALFDTV